MAFFKKFSARALAMRLTAVLSAALIWVLPCTAWGSEAAASDGLRLLYEVVDGNAVITGYEAIDDAVVDHLVIPQTLDGHPVTAIGDNAFVGCWYVLDSITIPDGVTSIGDGAFQACANIRKIIIPDSVTSIGNNAFANSPNLTDAAILNSVNAGNGSYEGDYDADGKRSGFGTWAYHNFLYVGSWENDLPNGEGTLYAVEICRFEDGHTEPREHVLHGHWVDGAAEGIVDVTDSWPFYYGDPVATFRVGQVKEGVVTKDHLALATNYRRAVPFYKDFYLGGVEPWHFGGFETDNTVETPWALSERYPHGRVEHTWPELTNTGLGITPGNLANRNWGNDMAALGDWIFIAHSQSTPKSDLVSLYKMRADGTQMMKLHESEHGAAQYLAPEFQVIGDWLYVGDLIRAVDDYTQIDQQKMKADDVDFSREENGELKGLVVDDWEYQIQERDPTYVFKAKLDYSETAVLGTFGNDGAFMDVDKVLFADADWVYIYRSNRSDVNEIIRAANDGSGRVTSYSFRDGVTGSIPQIVKGRMYYTQEFYADGHGTMTDLLSVDAGFTEAPVTLIPLSEEQHITALHVTEDFIYYGSVTTQTGEGAIIRADLDGGNPTVLAGGFETGHQVMSFGEHSTGSMPRILMAGDWMMFSVFRSDARQGDEQIVWYLMRLDGSGLHELGTTFVPEDAPGQTDSTGKWRYELLPDGSAAILGPGSKLKLAGKLAIPATVDKMPVTAIAANAFYGGGLTGVTLPKSLTSIGDYAFFRCQWLTEVTVPEGVASIGAGAFQGCAKVKKVALPASLTSLGQQAFADCPAAKFTVSKKSEHFAVVDGALFDKAQNKAVE